MKPGTVCALPDNPMAAYALGVQHGREGAYGERLERIATAVLAAFAVRDSTHDADAHDAVKAARALIAALDKEGK